MISSWEFVERYEGGKGKHCKQGGKRGKGRDQHGKGKDNHGKGKDKDEHGSGPTT